MDDESVVAPELQTESCAHDHARQWSEAEVVDRRRTVILDVFGSVNARSGALDHAIRLLLLAAQTGMCADIQSATVQIERVLRDRCLM